MQQLFCVDPDRIDAFWPLVSALIDSAYAELEERTPDVRQWLVEKKGLLWVLIEEERIIAAGTTSLVMGRDGLYCRAVTCGGSGADWQAVITAIEEYAAVEGCYKVRIDGRRGWGRVLPGYRPASVTFEKRI